MTVNACKGVNMSHAIRFYKMQGAGNDFAVVFCDPGSAEAELRDSRSRITRKRRVEIELLVAVRIIVVDDLHPQRLLVSLAILPHELVSEVVGKLYEFLVLGGLLGVERHLRRRAAGRPAAADHS